MDAYEDTLKAFDDLIGLLNQDPFATPDSDGDRYLLERPPGEYASEVAKKSQRITHLMNHLIEDGLRFPNDYAWRRFRETIESGCHFEIGGRYRYDAEAQREVLKIVRTARENLIALYASAPSPRRSSSKAAKRPRSEPDLNEPPSKSQNIGHGWPAKVVFAMTLTGAWVWGYPRLAGRIVPNVELNTAYALGLIATSLTVFFGAITLANIVRKP